MKPGIKSTEFWLTLLAMVLALALFVAESTASEGSAVVKGLAMAVAGLAQLGYTFGRSKAKAADALASVAAKQAEPPKE